MTFGLAVAGFLLASWVDARVGDSRPEAPAKRIGLCLVAVLLLQASVAGLYLFKSQTGLMVGVFGLFLPALVFAMLTGMWLIRMLADITGLARR